MLPNPVASITYEWPLAHQISQLVARTLPPHTAIIVHQLYILTVYSFDDTAGDTSLSRFDINRAPSYLFQTIRDIQSINALIRVHLLPWSPVRTEFLTGRLNLFEYSRKLCCSRAG
jgi:hypothetical protein